MNLKKIIGYLLMLGVLAFLIIDFMRCPLWRANCRFTGIIGAWVIFKAVLIIMVGILFILEEKYEKEKSLKEDLEELEILKRR